MKYFNKVFWISIAILTLILCMGCLIVHFSVSYEKCNEKDILINTTIIDGYYYFICEREIVGKYEVSNGELIREISTEQYYKKFSKYIIETPKEHRYEYFMLYLFLSFLCSFLTVFIIVDLNKSEFEGDET
jgi:hypothetical protein